MGEIISEKLGVAYEQYIYDNILHPLGLNDTHPDLPESQQQGRLATGYSIESREGIRKELPLFQANSISPAAGFYSTVKDLAKFAIWQFNTLDGNDNSILNGNTLKEMQKIHWKDPDEKTVWGLGFGIEKLNEETFVYHSGCCPGYLSQFVLCPKNKWAFIVLINCLGIDTFQYVNGMYSILSSYLKEKTEENSLEVNLEDYYGIYHYFSVGERLVVPWKGKLATFCLQSPNQNKPEMLMKHTKGDIFKRIREDGSLAEEIKFERDNKGKVVRFWQHYQFADKMNLNSDVEN